MYIPLDQIYNYLGEIIDPDILIYRFLPHGSKNLEDLSLLKYHDRPPRELRELPVLIMHDQEPLNFDFYNQAYLREHMTHWLQTRKIPNLDQCMSIPELANFLTSRNLNFVAAVGQSWVLYDNNIIVHSEMNSVEVDKYEQSGLHGLYWWSHAMIARDWYRYAAVDPQLYNLPDTYAIDFNIYNRAWLGTREYRLLFADLIIEHNLAASSNIKFNPQDVDGHYLNHQFKNPRFRPTHDLTQLPINDYGATASADYSSKDYQTAWFDVVLETLFDDSRQHLTEKILRPIACGKPFILVGTAGCLKYLHSYGFKTFDGIIDESYDSVIDPVERMKQIIQCMSDIQSWSQQRKQQAQLEIQKITAHNRDRFFSQEFVDQVLQEFVNNFKTAKSKCDQHKHGQSILTMRRLAAQDPKMKLPLLRFNERRTRQDLVNLLLKCRRPQK
jgi:hypothetical protein